MLSGWDIDILTEEEESKRRQEEFNTRSQMFIEALDIEDVIAHLMVTEGFASVEEVAFVPKGDLSEIEGFDEEISEELQERARNWLEERDKALDIERKKLGVEEAVIDMQRLTLAQTVLLGRKGTRTVDDIAGLTTDELRFLLMEIETEVKVDDLWEMSESDVGRLVRNSPLHGDEANAIIMAARQIIYGDDVIKPEPLIDANSDTEVTAEVSSEVVISEADALFSTPSDVGK
jgi:N utilization substance protein A